MTTFKKAELSNLVLLSILLSTVTLATSSAHGDAGHGENEVVAPTDQMNVKVADLDTVEVVVKYPTPKPAEEITLLLLLTDLKSNAPVGGANLRMTITQIDSSPTSGDTSSNRHAAGQSIEATASPTDTPGIYQAKVTFPEVGEYSLELKLGSGNLSDEVEIAGIVVPKAEVQAEAAGTAGGKRLPLAIGAMLLFILAGVMSYLFWIRPRSSGRTGELDPIYTPVQEYE